jgi:hypothetical protein
MVLSLRQSRQSPGSRAAAHRAQRIATRPAMHGDSFPKRLSTRGRTRARIRGGANARAIVVVLLVSAAAGLTSVPVAIAEGRFGRANHPVASSSRFYSLVDPGTFGGSLNFLNLPGIPVTNDGVMLGSADTTIADTDFPNFNPFIVGFPDPVLAQAFEWRNGHLRNLGALPGNNSSAVFEVNDHDVGAGMSENGLVDPNTGWPAENAVVFKDGHVMNLGTLAGGYESQALAINDRGDVAGFASNGTPDPVSFFG